MLRSQPTTTVQFRQHPPGQATSWRRRSRHWRPFCPTKPIPLAGDCHHGGTALGHALLSVKPGAEPAFEAAFAQAKEIIAGMAGFGRLSLSRCVEQPSTYLLLVEWRRLEDHIEGFRGSPQYQEWRRLLHHFSDPLPTVEHFAQADTV